MRPFKVGAAGMQRVQRSSLPLLHVRAERLANAYLPKPSTGMATANADKASEMRPKRRTIIRFSTMLPGLS